MSKVKSYFFQTKKRLLLQLLKFKGQHCNKLADTLTLAVKPRLFNNCMYLRGYLTGTRRSIDSQSFLILYISTHIYLLLLQ